MALTAEQETSLVADIAADPTLSTFPHDSDGAFAVAAAYNLDSDPAVNVWRTNMSTDAVRASIVWTEYIAAVSQSEHNAFTLITQNGIVDASDPNVRQGFQDIFSGPNKDQTLAALTAAAQRVATRAEALFATGSGAVKTTTFEGSLSYQDVLRAWQNNGG